MLYKENIQQSAEDVECFLGREDFKMKKISISIATALLVSGCALPNYNRGPHVKGNQTLEMDLALCRLNAEEKGPPSVLRRVAMADACMKAKEYIAGKGDKP